jgi:hypothetical protein
MRLGCAILALLLIPCCLWGASFAYREAYRIPAEQRQVLEQADRIVDAIEQFHSNNGRYPESLSELVPSYLNVLPEHPTGWSYNYTRSGEECSLSFAMPTGFPGWPGNWLCRSVEGRVPCYHLGD